MQCNGRCPGNETKSYNIYKSPWQSFLERQDDDDERKARGEVENGKQAEKRGGGKKSSKWGGNGRRESSGTVQDSGFLSHDFFLLFSRAERAIYFKKMSPLWRHLVVDNSSTYQLGYVVCKFANFLVVFVCK